MVGETVGSYKVLRQIGEGGMGVVYLVEHTVIGKRAAMKMLLPQYSHSEAIVTRFFNEAKATAKTKHPGLIEIYDFGHHANGSAFIVMEFLDGEPLSAKIKREGPQPLSLTIELSRQVAAALQAAHAAGIVHRDLKPDNVFLIKSEELQCGLRAKVLDFGIAKVIDSASTSQMKTRTGILMGTPAYMSPEQCQGASRVDQRADVYSLGCMMFEMASGKPPYNGDGLGAVIAAHLYEKIPQLVQVPQLDPLIERAMAKKADERYQNMGELLADLDALLMRRPIAKRAAPVDMRADTIAASEVADLTLPSVKTGRGGRWLAAVGALALAAAGVAWFVKSHQHKANDKIVVNDVAKNTAENSAKTTDNNSTVNAVKPTANNTVEPAKEEPKTVGLMIETTPPGAAVFRAADGVRVGQTPYTATVARGEGEAEFLLKLAGYRDATLSFPTDRDGAKSLLLTRAGHAPAHGGHDAHATSGNATAAVAPGPDSTRPAPKPDAPQPAHAQPKSRSLESGELHSPF